MAKIILEVEIDSLRNNQLDEVEAELFLALKKVTETPDWKFSKDISVSEIDREVDEDEDEAT